ncbi:MAG TPA: TetR/AcrR family transcriptional regulator [Ktedonobacterales bacterium]|nr:TetR/AcrR family transcriptional regulator [Ktedonobacterales bacterium]
MTVNTRPENSARHYHSPKRRQQAGATRRRILAAAERLFASRGYAVVTMDDIAREGKVSLATVYLHFPGRSAVIGALAEEITAAPELSVEQVFRESDPIEQVQIGARILRQLNERAWLIADILRSHRGTDPELERLWALWQQRHLHANRQAVAAIAGRGALRPGLSVDEAADVLYAIAGTEVYRALTQERGWTPARYQHWLFETACRELLASPR